MVKVLAPVCMHKMRGYIVINKSLESWLTASSRLLLVLCCYCLAPDLVYCLEARGEWLNQRTMIWGDDKRHPHINFCRHWLLPTRNEPYTHEKPNFYDAALIVVQSLLPSSLLSVLLFMLWPSANLPINEAYLRRDWVVSMNKLILTIINGIRFWTAANGADVGFVITSGRRQLDCISND